MQMCASVSSGRVKYAELPPAGAHAGSQLNNVAIGRNVRRRLHCVAALCTGVADLMLHVAMDNPSAPEGWTLSFIRYGETSVLLCHTRAFSVQRVANASHGTLHRLRAAMTGIQRGADPVAWVLRNGAPASGRGEHAWHVPLNSMPAVRVVPGNASWRKLPPESTSERAALASGRSVRVCDDF